MPKLERGTDLEPHTSVTAHDIYDRAKEIKRSAKFILSCYSDLSALVLLELHEHIARLEDRWSKDKSAWTEDDFNQLQKKLKQYCKYAQYPTVNLRRSFDVTKSDSELATSIAHG